MLQKDKHIVYGITPIFLASKPFPPLSHFRKIPEKAASRE